MRSDFVFQEQLCLPPRRSSDFSRVKTIEYRILFVVSQMSKIRWNLRTSTPMQTRLNTTRLSKKP